LNYDKNDFELIIIYGNSTDDTLKIINTFREQHQDVAIKLIEEEGTNGIGYALALGIEQAKGEYIAVTNADCTVERDWLLKLVEQFKDDSIGAVAGIVKTPKDASLLQRMIGYGLDYRYSRFGSNIISAPDINIMYRKPIIQKVGGYDWKKFRSGQDVEISYKINNAGYKIKYVPSIEVFHNHRATLTSYWKQQVLAAKTRVDLLRYFPKSKRGDNIALGTLMVQPLLFAMGILTLPFAFFTQTQIVATVVWLLFSSVNLVYTTNIYRVTRKLEAWNFFFLNFFRNAALSFGILSNLTERMFSRNS
jgi:GT2 family glycosyltransferase